MKKYLGLCFIVVMFMTSACAKYIQPIGSPPISDRFIVVNKGIDETWEMVLKNMTEGFFVINNIERVSGFINLSFVTNNGCNYIDCGSYRGASQSYRFCDNWGKPILLSDGTLINGHTASLHCALNVLVQEIDKTNTKIKIKVRYVLNVDQIVRQIGSNIYVPRSWNILFDSDTCGYGAGFKCIPNGQLEREIISRLSM